MQIEIARTKKEWARQSKNKRQSARDGAGAMRCIHKQTKMEHDRIQERNCSVNCIFYRILQDFG